MYNGQKSPRFHDKKHILVERRSPAKTFYKPINAKLDSIPSFLRAKRATDRISPASHDPLDSMKKACLKNNTFYSRKEKSPKTFIDQAVNLTKKNPGVGHYKQENIAKAYDKITLGASKGWKWGTPG